MLNGSFQEQIDNSLSIKKFIDGIPLFNYFLCKIFRYWSIAPLITRECTSDLNLDRLFIPTGTHVNLFT